MASEEHKADDLTIAQDKILEAEEGEAETDAFQCSRCKQRKCRYRQVQTRSADEPMTTYVTCMMEIFLTQSRIITLPRNGKA
ncbi:hypothetical protein C2E23DRAFT_886989 [Lenzites betulinus]|nr:hypothetical protein C2E23DRAFT_886989 [Lenzites betulinus]